MRKRQILTSALAVIAISVIMAGCGGVAQMNGKWRTVAKAGGTASNQVYVFSDTSTSFGKGYYSTSGTWYNTSNNLRSLEIRKDASGETTKYYLSTSSVTVYIMGEVLSVNTEADTRKLVNGDTAINVTGILYPALGGSTYRYYKSNTASEVYATRLDISCAAGTEIDVQKELKVEFKYSTATETDKQFSYTFDLTKAELG